jgi:hypothetical protein
MRLCTSTIQYETDLTCTDTEGVVEPMDELSHICTEHAGFLWFTNNVCCLNDCTFVHSGNCLSSFSPIILWIMTRLQLHIWMSKTCPWKHVTKLWTLVANRAKLCPRTRLESLFGVVKSKPSKSPVIIGVYRFVSKGHWTAKPEWHLIMVKSKVGMSIFVTREL